MFILTVLFKNALSYAYERVRREGVVKITCMVRWNAVHLFYMYMYI